MAIIKGTVTQLYVFGDYGWTRITDSSGDITKVIIWSDYVEEYSAHQRLIHGMWVAMLREALSSGKTVEAHHDEAMILMESLNLHA